jgi:Na+/H+ antiporter NhaD/arsenite permease-like protein
MAEAHAASLGATLPFGSIAPFALMLLAIAIVPLRWPHFWESNANKGIVSAILGAPVALYVATHDPELLWHTALEYVSFIALLGALFTISGGIVLRGDLRATPAVNTGFLALGALLANLIGTTGASMLIIRPLLQTNSERKHVGHIPILFIFVVSNCAGLLTPLGDPPLFLGYLRGVPFFWTFRLLPEWLFVVSILLLVFYVLDTRAVARESAASLALDVARQRPLTLAGAHNFFYLAGIVVAVLVSPLLPEGVIRDVIRLGAMGAMTLLSLRTTHPSLRTENGFTFGPMTEVAVLFAGIFATMIPALEILRVRGAELGIAAPWQFFWLSGGLSSFLDNAPTYLTFAALAQSLGPGADTAVHLAGGPVSATLLTAISAGSVLMGANSYIGNGPNFMVKAIAEEQGVAMPSFGGYMLWSGSVLIPIFVLMTFIFFV